MPFEKTLIAAICLALVFMGRTAAGGVQGAMELTQIKNNVETTDSSGVTTKQKSRIFTQRYRLSFDDALYPNLDLSAGGQFDKVKSESGDFNTTLTNYLPWASVNLHTPFVYAGIRYDKRVQKYESVDLSPPKNLRQTVSAFLGFRPEGLPPLDLRFDRSHTYDAAHASRDFVSKSFSLMTSYTPVRQVDLNYTAILGKTEDLKGESSSETTVQTGRASYRDVFMNGRASVSSNVSINKQEATLTRSSGGGVIFQLFPVAGLSAINNDPTTGNLTSTRSLIDGDVTVSTGLNLVQSPSSPDTRYRNAGVDFGVATEVNKFFVWVDAFIPNSALSKFAWQIYTSTDNQNWVKQQDVPGISFGQFDNRFEISFTTVKTRYIKAVIRPVTAPTSLSDYPSSIFITEIQAFLQKSPTETSAKSAQTTDVFDFGFRFNILTRERSSVYYDLYYQDVRSSHIPNTYTLTNAITANRRFNDIVSGYARLTHGNEARVDSSLSYTAYDASLTAAKSSLPKLNHILTVTAGRREEDGKASNSATAVLTNTAEVYPGINGGLTLAENVVRGADRSETRNTMSTFGLDLVPHRAVMISLHDTETRIRQTGGGVNSRSSISLSRDASASFNPVSTLYLTASIAATLNDGRRQTIHNYALSWQAQQRDGALQFSLVYSESLAPEEGNARTRVIAPGLRWKINPRAFFDLSFPITRIDSDLQTTKARSVTAGFKMYL